MCYREAPDTDGGDSSYLLSLLDEGERPEEHSEHVERVAHDVQQVPHVMQVLPQTFLVDLLHFLPNEACTETQHNQNKVVK